MPPDFSTVQNHHEAAVFAAVTALAPAYPAIGDDAGLLADVACVALNRLAPRYIRHAVDLHFFRAARERAEHRREVEAAVRAAFEFVQARTLLGARS